MCRVSDWRDRFVRFFSFYPHFCFGFGVVPPPPFVLTKDGSGMCPVCTVYYRHCPAGTLVLLGFPAPNPAPALIPSDLAWQRQEVQKKGQYCSAKVRAEVGRQHVGIFSYLIKTQNVSVSIFHALALASFLSLKIHLPELPHLVCWQPERWATEISFRECTLHRSLGEGRGAEDPFASSKAKWGVQKCWGPLAEVLKDRT